MSDFLAIPAIDLLSGKCVRLEQGDYARATVYDGDPAGQALAFVKAGAMRLHVVDLDGAKDGESANLNSVRAIVNVLSAHHPDVEIEFGGGLRDPAAVERTLAAGAHYAVLGTAAIRDPEFLVEMTAEFPGRILLGLDARGGLLAVHGWTETTTVDAVEFAKSADSMGIAGIIHTDIDRDGVLKGPNLEATAMLAAQVGCPVYLSGGVARISDIMQARDAGLAGAIIGKALYSGQFTAMELFASLNT